MSLPDLKARSLSINGSIVVDNKRNIKSKDLNIKTINGKAYPPQDQTITNLVVTGTASLPPPPPPPYIVTNSSNIVLTAEQTVGGLTIEYNGNTTTFIRFPISLLLTNLIGTARGTSFDVWVTSTLFGAVFFDFSSLGGGYTIQNQPAFPTTFGQQTQILRFVLNTNPPQFPNFTVYFK